MTQPPDPTPSTTTAETVGVGPWPGGPEAWPRTGSGDLDPDYDPELLTEGDRRNVVDGYRYLTMDAIVADLDRRRHPLHVAIENWGHDLNIGSVVRTANAFAAKEIHIVGRRRWNRRGAMVTDRYQHVRNHPDVAAFLDWAGSAGVPVIGIDNVPGSVPLEAMPSLASARCSSARRAPGSPRKHGPPAGTSSTSPSSGRRARSTPGPQRRSRCTHGCSSTRRSRRSGSPVVHDTRIVDSPTGRTAHTHRLGFVQNLMRKSH